jgi:hypothetical protein
MAKGKMAGSVQIRTALVVGGARCVWRDLDAALSLGKYDAVLCVNDIGTVFEDRIDFWCTLHPEKFKPWQAVRAVNGFNNDYIAVCHELNPELGKRDNLPRIDKSIDYRYPGMDGSGSSGLFAVKVAQDHGFNRIVLAGIPMKADEAHFFDDKVWTERDQFLVAWKIARPAIKDAVRSMSGWTRQLLGAPTSLWLSEPTTSGADHG